MSCSGYKFCQATCPWRTGGSGDAAAQKGPLFAPDPPVLLSLPAVVWAGLGRWARMSAWSLTVKGCRPCPFLPLPLLDGQLLVVLTHRSSGLSRACLLAFSLWSLHMCSFCQGQGTFVALDSAHVASLAVYTARETFASLSWKGGGYLYGVIYHYSYI